MFNAAIWSFFVLGGFTLLILYAIFGIWIGYKVGVFIGAKIGDLIGKIL